MALSVVSKAHLLLDVGKIHDRAEKIRNPEEAQDINQQKSKESQCLVDQLHGLCARISSETHTETYHLAQQF